MDSGLRELVKRYFHGEMSYGQYRSARGRLIDAVAGTDACDTASGITAPHVRTTTEISSPPATARDASQPQTQADAPTPTQMRPRRAPLVVSNAPQAASAAPHVVSAAPQVAAATPHVKSTAPSGEQSAASGGRRVGLIAAGALVLSGVIGSVLFFGNRTSAPVAVQASAVAETGHVTAGQKVLADFLSANDWSAGGIDTFSHGWDALDPAERQAARHTPEFQRLADALYQRIAEQRALDDAGGAAPSQGKQIISAFAQYLGIDYASLHASAAAVPSQPSAVATPPPVPAVPAATVKPVETTSKVEAAPEPVPAATPPAVAESVPPVEKPTVPVPEQPAAAVATPVPAVAVTPKPEPAASKKMPKTDKADAATAGSAGACRVALLGTRRPFCNDLVAEGLDGPLLVVIPGGEFQMGGTQTAEEQPPHQVHIARPFAMSVHEISVAEFLRYCQAAHVTCPKGRWPADDYPVVDVSWRDAEAYVRWLSQVTGHHYRLPSEAEWEYAARAGSTTKYPGGDELLITDARFSVEKPETAPVPISDHSINRNRFRLANMVGNVREWVQDVWQNSYLGAPADGSARAGGSGERVVRGGSYADSAVQLRSAAREHLPMDSQDAMTGFRVVRELME